MTMRDRPIDTSLAVAISLVTRSLRAAMKPAGYRWSKQPKRSIWWITSSSGYATRLSYHAAIGWLVVSESPHHGVVIDSLVQTFWRKYSARLTNQARSSQP